jgi:hypothetical protein
MAISTDAAPSKQRKKNKSSNSANTTQSQVKEHPVEVQPLHPTSTVHSITNVGTSECPDATILRDEDASQRVHEISINYLESRESYDRKTIIIDIYFSALIAKILKNDPDPKTMAECKKSSDWNQWKDVIQAEISSLSKREVFSQVIPTPQKYSPWDSNGFSFASEMRTMRW